MDMIGKIRRLHGRGKKSEREIARMTLDAAVDAPPEPIFSTLAGSCVDQGHSPNG